MSPRLDEGRPPMKEKSEQRHHACVSGTPRAAKQQPTKQSYTMTAASIIERPALSFAVSLHLGISAVSTLHDKFLVYLRTRSI